MCLLSLSAQAQTTSKDFSLEVSSPIRRLDLPSASGVTALDGRFWVVGDDSPWLYEIDPSLAIVAKHKIKDFPLEPSGRIAKKFKPDLEAMAGLRLGGRDYQLILGSGSEGSQQREWAYLMSVAPRENSSEPSGKNVERSLGPLYAQLKAAGGLKELNIEGLALSGKQAFILNRVNAGGNMIFVLPQEELIDYVQGRRKAISSIEAYPVRLPRVKNFEAGLSGIEYWAARDSLVYTASVEATSDSYSDGEVLASFVGVIPLKALQRGSLLDLSTSALALRQDDHFMLTKAESIAIVNADAHTIDGLIVSDLDDGSSEFLRFKLGVR